MSSMKNIIGGGIEVILDFGNYRVITDDKQFITQEKRVKQENQFTKEENIGQEYYADLGYYREL